MLKTKKRETAFDEDALGPLAHTASLHCRTALEQMLRVDPEKRPSAQDLLHLAFFTDVKPCTKDRKTTVGYLEKFIHRRLLHPEFDRCSAHQTAKVMRKAHAAGGARDKELHARVVGKQDLFSSK